MYSRYTFPRSCRILKTDDFSSVFNFNNRLHGRFLNLYVKPNQVNMARLGVVVGKKQIRTAVARNYAKRIIRETFRLQRLNLPALDYLVRVSKPINQSDALFVRHELINLFHKCQKCLNC